MLRFFLVCAGTLAVLVPAAAGAGGPVPTAVQGGGGIAAPAAGVRYVALELGVETVLQALRTRDGTVLRYRTLTGKWGIPLVTANGTTGGLDRRGSTLVLGDATPKTSPLRKLSGFLVVSTRNLRIQREIEIRGDFAFDALSPDARTLYLIQYVSARDTTRYRVRAYDLRRNRLLPGVIADKRQESWVMSGYAVARATGPGSRWVYTLYSQPNNYPFVHALDTVARTAVCIGIPWRWTDAEGIARARLQLTRAGDKLEIVDGRANRPRYVMDTKTFRVA